MAARHVLMKEITVLNRLTGTTCTWLCVATALLSLLLHLVALSSPGWLVVRQAVPGGGSLSRDVGLWAECHEELGCRYFGISEINDGFRATQAFGVLTLVGGATCLALLAAYVMSYDVKRDPRLVTVVAVIRGFTVLLLIMSTWIFASHWSPGLYGADAFSGSLHYAWGLEVTCVVMETLGVVCAAAEVFLWMKQVEVHDY